MKSEKRPVAAASIIRTPATEAARFFIEDVYPTLEEGRWPVKRIAGEPIEIWADIFRDGHEVTTAALLWRRNGQAGGQTERLRHFSNDRWAGTITPTEPGRYTFVIQAWTDAFATWRRDLLLKLEAGQTVELELLEGAALIAGASGGGKKAKQIIDSALKSFQQTKDAAALLTDELVVAMEEAQARPDLTASREFPLTIDRERARAGAWYEFFPRSQGRTPGVHGTFDDCISRLPDISAHGFDVVYLPPIHPIGKTNRKGRNNALTAGSDDPGSPYAIGGEEGGHDAIHPQLGTLDDFRRFVRACEQHGMEVALDFATQCSPDHPWLKNHSHWFRRRPDGSIKYAENPPKKYQDIHNPDFYCDEKAGLWNAFRDVVQFWVDQGVRIFRVDNPHTKPFPFWEWLIRDIQSRDPGVLFLSEAFTRPKVMKALAKLGFTQSYTYFTWRTTKEDFSEYLSELTRHPEREFYRPNFFVNTPDILPVHLQSGESWMFKSRVALAATLSSNYGVYSGFELLEHEPIPGKEEYLDSEKYEIKVRDWDQPGNIKPYIRDLNRIRRENPALLQTADLRWLQIDDAQVIGFLKESFAKDNAVAAAIALDRHGPREFWMHFGDLQIGPPSARRQVTRVENLKTGEYRALEYGGLRVRMDPWQDPAILYRCH
jgi:starch synthase (maltosyl-transferring)